MQCSRCGYVLGEFETDCLRCKRTGGGTIPVTRLQAAPALTAAGRPAGRAREPAGDEKECPRCGKATAGAAAACDKCGYEYRPGESQAERYQALLAEEARTPAPPPALQRTVSPYVSWGLIGVCLLAVLGASYAMLIDPPHRAQRLPGLDGLARHLPAPSQAAPRGRSQDRGLQGHRERPRRLSSPTVARMAPPFHSPPPSLCPGRRRSNSSPALTCPSRPGPLTRTEP